MLDYMGVSRGWKVPDEAVKRFELVKALLREEPKRANMASWMELDRGMAQDNNAPGHWWMSQYEDQEKIPECGTVGCIAGWWNLAKRMEIPDKEGIKLAAIALAHEDRDFGDMMIRDLGIENQVLSGEMGLFYVGSWPYDLKMKLLSLSSQTPEYAEVMCEAIDRFIADPGAFIRMRVED